MRGFRLVVLAWLGSLTAVACGGGGGGPEPLEPIDIRTSLLLSDDNDAFPDSTTIVVRDDDRYEEIWEQSRAPGALTPIDFEREMVLVVAVGRMTPGDAVSVDSAGVREIQFAGGSSEDVLVVKGRIIQACSGFEGASYPYQIVRVTRFDGPVQVELTRAGDMSCGAAPPSADGSRSDGAARAGPDP